MARLLLATLLFTAACHSDTQGTGQDLAGTPHTDAAVDAASVGYDCKAPPSDLTSCSTAADCGSVARGCYCGQQPVTGVALKYVASAASCETAAASSCALGCAIQTGRQADDGKTIPDGTDPTVSCDSGTCRTHVP